MNAEGRSQNAEVNRISDWRFQIADPKTIKNAEVKMKVRSTNGGLQIEDLRLQISAF
jgi:hypothetical protein